MYTLQNDQLTLSLLDPATDTKLLGSRYVAGGYIHQVTDAVHGPLLSGPEYPEPQPNPFNGQGAPDMFFTPLGGDNAAVGDEVGVIGVGRVRRTSEREPFDVRHNPEVIEFLPWQVEQDETSVTMRTAQEFQGWAYMLERRVELVERTIRSRTSIRSAGESTLPVRWFPHPFFPPTTDGVQCRFSVPIELPENPAYFLNDDDFICLDPDFNWTKGHFQPLGFSDAEEGMTITQRHPLVSEVVATIDYATDFLPIWGNARTFSFEPYFDTALAQGESATWQIDYTF